MSRLCSPSENEIPELLNAEPGPAVPLIDGFAPLLSDEDETVEMDDMMADQPEPEIFERSSPDPWTANTISMYDTSSGLRRNTPGRGPIRDTDNTA